MAYLRRQGGAVMQGNLFVGLMSGTSLDGIDAVLVELTETEEGVDWEVLDFRIAGYSAERRSQLLAVIERGTPSSLARLHVDLGEWFAGAALDLCRSAGVEPKAVTAIGSHGQTVWHEPRSDDHRGCTLQLGDPATLAERTGIDVVSDFRARDIAVGGEGAPLVPFADKILFAASDRHRVVQNLGGMANVTWLPKAGSGEPLLAFDTGPGMVLIDAAVERMTRGERRFDEGGVLARSGVVVDSLLEELLCHSYLTLEPPKSTGREAFGRAFLEEATSRVRGADLVATLTAYTARTIGDAYRRWVIPRGVDDVFLAGGGARNPALVERIEMELDGIPVKDCGVLGLDPDAREATAFAILAWAHLRGVPGNVPTATGAKARRVLGSYTPKDLTESK